MPLARVVVGDHHRLRGEQMLRDLAELFVEPHVTDRSGTDDHDAVDLAAIVEELSAVAHDLRFAGPHLARHEKIRTRDQSLGVLDLVTERSETAAGEIKS